MDYIKKLFNTKDEINKEMKFIKFLADKKLIISITLTTFLVVTMLMNFTVNSIVSVANLVKGEKEKIGILHMMFKLRMFSFPIFYIVAYFFTSILLWKIFFNLKASFRTIKEGQKGTSRFTTLEELKEQYRAIPEKTLEFEGKGGFPVSRYEDKIFIDDSPVNNLIIGTTRSGKGETVVFPLIDIYSRAKEKASLVINDPKGELIAASSDTLEKRGYRILLLNLLNPMNSMSYNAMQLIIDAYEKDRYSEAQSLCSTLTYTLYYKPSAKDPFWQNSAMSLVNALILAVIDECFNAANLIQKEIDNLDKKDSKIKKLIEKKKKIKAKTTLYTVANMLSELGSKEDTMGNNELDNYFSKLPASSPAKMQYATSKFADGSTRGGIFATAMSGLQIFTLEEIAKMSSMNSLDLKDVGFLSLKDNRPVAIFMVTPDYDASNHVIASIFVRQLYYVLAKEASLSKTGKCDREVIYLLDEFGNMPAIEGMEKIVTVCLGRGIRFNLIIQAYSQLKKLYGDDDKTIIGNCGNQVYILTNEDETAETFSKLVGDKTIEIYSRSGEILDTTKHQTESLDSRRLLKSEELRSLKEGESVVVRVIKRQDLKRNRIVPYPIFNHDETSLKYRYEYLSEDFDNSKSLATVQVKTLHESVNLEDLLLFNDNDETIEELEEKEIVDENNILISDIYNDEEISEINNILEKYCSYDIEINELTKWEEIKVLEHEKLNKFIDIGYRFIGNRRNN